MNSSYVGTVYTNKELSNSYISSIEEQFSKKFNVKSFIIAKCVIMMVLKLI